jgi:hypothetical protein
MTPNELHRALADMPARSAQVLGHRVLEARSRDECAALYSLKLPQWDVLFARAVHDFERALGGSPPDDDADAPRLAESLTPELQQLFRHRDEVKRLMEKAQADYEASPRYTVEVWARRLAIVGIIALTLYFYLK